MPAVLEQARHLTLDLRKVLGVNALAPEVGIVQIFAWGVAEQPLDIGADEGRGEVASGLEAIDHGGRGIEQLRKPLLGSGLDLGHMLPFFFLVLARRLGQDTLDDVGYAFGIGAGWQHFTKRRRCNLGVFSRRCHLDDG
jgi:hypothetical protein